MEDYKINTIFYYPSSKGEYEANRFEISPRTICFVPDEKSIYKGGVRYGSTSIDDLKTQMEQIFNENPYTLPIATASKLGGIMIGDGLSINPETGKVDVDFSGFSNGSDGQGGQNGTNGLDGIIKTIFDSVTNIRASKTDYGIVKIGDGINVNDGVISVNPFDPNNLSQETIEALKGDKGDTGAAGRGISSIAKISSTGTNPVIDTYRIIYTDGTHFDYTVTNGTRGADGSQGEPGSGGDLVEYDDTELRQLISALDDAIDQLNQTADEESDRLDDLIEDLDSEIQDKVEELMSEAQWFQTNVAQGLVGSFSNFGDEDVEAYLQTIGFWTTDSHGNTVTQWSKISQDVQSIQSTVNSLTAASSGDYQALQSSIEQYVDNEVGAAVTNIGNTYVKISDIDDVIEWMYSGLKSSASSNMSYASLIAAGRNNTLPQTNAISEIGARVTTIEGNLASSSWIESKVDSAIAGLKNSVTSNSAKTEIFNKIDQNSTDIAGIVTSITGDTSSASIATKIGNWKAGLITTSSTAQQLATAGIAAASDLTAASIVASVNASGSTVAINADKIKLESTHTEFLNAIGNNVTVKQLTATNGTNVTSVNATDGIKQTKNGTVFNQLSQNGSGTLAGGNISWDTSGNTTVIGTIQSGTTGQYVSITPGTTYGSISIGTDLMLTGTSTTGGWINLNNPYDNDISSILYGGTLRFATSNNTEDDAIRLSHSKSLDQTTAYFGKTSNSRPYSRIYSDADHSDILVTRGTSYISINTGYINNNGDPYIDLVSNNSQSCRITPSSVIGTSDIRLKNIIDTKTITAEQIADAPIFTYTPKGSEDSDPIIGTSAQYWENILPETVSTNNGYLALDYIKVNTASVINLAKEVVNLKQENNDLKTRLAAIESKLGIQ